MDWVNVVRAHHSASDATSGHTVSLSRNLVQLANLGPGWRIGPRAWDRRPLHIRIFQESQNLNAWGRDGWNVKPHALLVFMMHYASSPDLRWLIGLAWFQTLAYACSVSTPCVEFARKGTAIWNCRLNESLFFPSHFDITGQNGFFGIILNIQALISCVFNRRQALGSLCNRHIICILAKMSLSHNTQSTCFHRQPWNSVKALFFKFCYKQLKSD